MHRFYKLRIPIQFFPETFFKSWDGWQNEKIAFWLKVEVAEQRSVVLTIVNNVSNFRLTKILTFFQLIGHFTVLLTFPCQKEFFFEDMNGD